MVPVSTSTSVTQRLLWLTPAGVAGLQVTLLPLACCSIEPEVSTSRSMLGSGGLSSVCAMAAGASVVTTLPRASEARQWFSLDGKRRALERGFSGIIRFRVRSRLLQLDWPHDHVSARHVLPGDGHHV